ARWVEGDVGDQTKLERVLGEHQIEAVIHMAAFIEVGESVREPHKYLNNNTLQAVGLLEAMQRAGVRRLVLSSTAAVYAPSTAPLTETSPLAPASPYGLSKLFLERLLAWYASRGLHYFALRYFNAAGATPDGTCIRDYIHIRDLAAAHVIALDALAREPEIPGIPELSDRAFNLGNGTGFSVREVIAAAGRVVGHHIPTVMQPR